jgi:hypothetical protein
MNATSISFGLLVALFAILLLYKIRKRKPQVTGYGSQRMCPFCGLITSRFKECCLECGMSLSRLRKNSVRSPFSLRNDLPDALVPSPTHPMSQ